MCFFAITLTLTILNPFMVKEEKQTFIHPNLTIFKNKLNNCKRNYR